MPPADNNVPEPKAPKQGFFAKLFGKKPPVTPIVPPAESNTPPPQLDDPATSPEDNLSGPAVGVASPQTDSVTGAPQPSVESSPDASGDVTAPSLDVPNSVSDTTPGETPTLPVQPQPGEQPSAQTPPAVPGQDPTQKF
jgi:hypothetical protein